MLLTMEDLSPSIDVSTEELAWLQASAILDRPPLKDDDIFMQDLSTSSSADSFSLIPPTPTSPLATPPRNDSPPSEWIYRRPKSPITPRHTHRSAAANHSPYPRPMTGYTKQGPPSIARSSSTASTRTTRSTATALTLASSSRVSLDQDNSSSSNPFWSTVLRPRSRSERSIPLLKSIPSESQIVLTPPRKIISAPRSMAPRPPSVSSTLSSVSLSLPEVSRSPSSSPSSSRSESPVTPVSLSNSYVSGTGSGGRPRRKHQSPYQHRRHRILIQHPIPLPINPDSDASLALPPLSQSCPPSKSILTRTSSVSTKGSGSGHTVNKSVKFAAIPTIHYASRGYWDLETLDSPVDDMGINVDAMDVDVDDSVSLRFSERGYQEDTLDIAKLRELQCTTPTPEREKEKAQEKEKAKGLKRLMSLSRKPAPATTGTNTNAATAQNPSASASPRPVISTPYPLGTFPAHAQGIQLTASLRTTSSQRSRNSKPSKAAAGSWPEPDLLSQFHDGAAGTTLRTAPSCESFRSTKSTSARSTRSLGSMRSVKSTSSTRGFRAWLGRTIGWAES